MSTPLRLAERAYALSTRSGWQEFVTAPPRQRPDLMTAAQVCKPQASPRGHPASPDPGGFLLRPDPLPGPREGLHPVAMTNTLFH